ncbi:tRNA threonylcarbamoyladenosine biosynthesis protein TsaE [Anaerobacterium chartisolvens]|uniref:tRNA threonylcarbamoyladenosine biosynthesis protein TsaE n=1 Tax=Anaerobacterium chartisolvens TaxID=1297424 RepID=A0A369AUM5_9FIRM|nr:tRNA (adenosine(37)-N6)-threonylcarbamoyltransferase complex ATPase subunit type 1 TsaE [Anaerobacterium chartisolvens]RCX12743.1 tRNA threonylcarbamoyladenosine biosynthesis protein TsaE [Anaerobacterium chartisolvens]
MKRFKTFSEQETKDVGWSLGKLLKAGDLVCLKGDLGAGKTAFTYGIARAAGVQGYITSPTFTIVNEYNSSIPLYHFDVYRISDAEEMFDIGLEEYIGGEGISVIEWADLIQEVLPEEYIAVRISKEPSEGDNARIIEVEFRGAKYQGYEDALNRQALKGVK